jgi:hypothetical protein
MNVDLELLKYNDLRKWTPTVGDVVYCDGIFSRWWGIVTSVSQDGDVSVRKSGNLRLMVQGDFKDEIISFNKIVNSMVGSYTVVRDGVYYV